MVKKVFFLRRPSLFLSPSNSTTCTLPSTQSIYIAVRVWRSRWKKNFCPAATENILGSSSNPTTDRPSDRLNQTTRQDREKQGKFSVKIYDMTSHVQAAARASGFDLHFYVELICLFVGPEIGWKCIEWWFIDSLMHFITKLNRERGWSTIYGRESQLPQILKLASLRR